MGSQELLRGSAWGHLAPSLCRGLGCQRAPLGCQRHRAAFTPALQRQPQSQALAAPLRALTAGVWRLMGRRQPCGRPARWSLPQGLLPASPRPPRALSLWFDLVLAISFFSLGLADGRCPPACSVRSGFLLTLLSCFSLCRSDRLVSFVLVSCESAGRSQAPPVLAFPGLPAQHQRWDLRFPLEQKTVWLRRDRFQQHDRSFQM